jgi:metal-responsive CopG/Arc/MetJ family transcriptional regulator
MRLTDEIIAAVDAYVERERLKTRSEAFRRLVEIGLETVAKRAKPRRPAKRKDEPR